MDRQGTLYSKEAVLAAIPIHFLQNDSGDTLVSDRSKGKALMD